MSDQRYMMRGVSASKEDVHNAIKNIDKGLYPKAFCKIIPDILGGDPEYCNIMHADGAGTKSSLAYLYWKETGDLGVLLETINRVSCKSFHRVVSTNPFRLPVTFRQQTHFKKGLAWFTDHSIFIPQAYAPINPLS